jgi:hypothetical protein
MTVSRNHVIGAPLSCLTPVAPALSGLQRRRRVKLHVDLLEGSFYYSPAGDLEPQSPPTSSRRAMRMYRRHGGRSSAKSSLQGHFAACFA